MYQKCMNFIKPRYMNCIFYVPKVTIRAKKVFNHIFKPFCSCSDLQQIKAFTKQIYR